MQRRQTLDGDVRQSYRTVDVCVCETRNRYTHVLMHTRYVFTCPGIADCGFFFCDSVRPLGPLDPIFEPKFKPVFCMQGPIEEKHDP